MDTYQDWMEKLRVFRTKHLSGIGRFFLRIKISANIMTGLSLIFGLLSVYYLFSNYLLFLIFAVLHLIADALDGVIARVSKSTSFGNYFDHICDGLVGLLVLIKVGMYTGDYLAYLVAGLYFLAQINYFISKQQSPIIFTRSLNLIGVALFLPVAIPSTKYLLTLVVLVNGVAYLYSLARQLQYFILHRKKN